MAHRVRLPCSESQLPQPLLIETDKDGKLTTQSVGALNSFMQTYAFGFNGHVGLGDGRQSAQSGNIDGQTILVMSPAVADTEFIVPHGLERIPIGRLILGQDKAGTLYDSNRGGWGLTQCAFKCDVASVFFVLVLV